jgi:hypothetical protein
MTGPVIAIKPRISYRDGVYTCRRIFVVGHGTTRRAAWNAMWQAYWDNQFSPVRRRADSVKAGT